MIWTLPNILTILRLLAAPAIALVFLFLARPYADWVALVLFVAASATDWLDGYIARAWNQTSKLGTMLDPIADKAMVVIALATLIGLSSLSNWLLFPATLILFREVFVSGLREFLGDTAGTLKVTKLAKWKTTIQMVAIAVLLGHGLVEHYFGMAVFGLDNAMIDAILSGAEEDVLGLRALREAVAWSAHGGVALLWVAALLTVITGIDYFRKALPYVKG